MRKGFKITLLGILTIIFAGIWIFKDGTTAGLFILPFVYLLPTFLVMTEREVLPIFALNFFLGWTFIGWVVALTWSLKILGNPPRHATA